MKDDPLERRDPDLRVWGPTTIPLPFVGGQPENQRATKDSISVVYEDSVDVYIEQSYRDTPYVDIKLVPSGPAEFTLMGFGPKQLRQFAKVCLEVADDLELIYGVKRS